MNWLKSRYTESLESQVAELRCQLAQERQEVRRLTDALVPALQRTNPRLGYMAHDAVLPQPASKLSHSITKAVDQKSASCSCGWKAESDDPVEMQISLSEHYKLAYPPTKAKRPSVSERIRDEEEKSLKESQNQRTTA